MSARPVILLYFTEAYDTLKSHQFNERPPSLLDYFSFSFFFSSFFTALQFIVRQSIICSLGIN
jgi:hypothetical protein